MLIKFIKFIPVLAVFLVTTLVNAQPYPNKPIRLVVPFAAGQGADVAARLIAQKLSEDLGQAIVIDNRPGAGGNIGAQAVAKAAPDGYTLLVGSNGTHAANPALYATLPFDPIKDFSPIAFTGSVPMVLLANNGFAGSTTADVIRMAKAAPGTLNVAIPSSTSRVVFEQFTLLSGASLFPVNYKSSPTAFTDLLGNQVPLSIDTLIAAAPQLKAGRVKAIAVSSRARSEVLPGVPSFNEAGLAGFDISAWNVWFAPQDTPAEAVRVLNAGIVRVLAQAEVKQRLRDLGLEPGGNQSPQAVGEFVAAEIKKWGDLIRRAGLKAE
jgi:tripartite-type tricarboxylate transporter receptor subunit TctC